MKEQSGKNNMFLRGVRDSIPIALGYFAVAFALGIQAKLSGLRWYEGFLASFLTHASAGEYAGYQVILEKSGYLSMILVTLVASARYFLMSCALSQRLRPNTSVWTRMAMAFGLTDEIFGCEISRPEYVEPSYAYGLFVLPFFGWASGCAAGILVGSALPAFLVNALSVALYGMFIAIIIPPARKNKVIAGGVLVSFICSFLCSRLPLIRDLSGGTRTVILTVVIASAMALLFPVKEAQNA